MPNKRSAGFSLIEILVAISILAILAVVGVAGYRMAQKSANNARKEKDVAAIAQAYELHYADRMYKPLAAADFVDQAVPKTPEGGNYYGLLQSDRSSFRVCAALADNPTPVCGFPTNTCYCRDSLQEPYTSETLGYTQVGTKFDNSDSNYMNGGRITVGSQNILMTSVTAYIHSPIDSSPNNKFQFGVYSDVNGQPKNFLASSPIGQIKGDSWNTLPLTLTLEANKSYWLMYNTNGTNSAVNNVPLEPDPTESSVYAWDNGQAFGTWPANFGPATVQDYRISIYANY